MIVPFIVNLRERVVSFQLTSHAVKVNTVTGNPRALFNIGDGPYLWRISPRMAGESYEQWRASVSRITKIHIKLEYPNPNWVDRETLRQMFGDLHAHAVEIKAQADEGDGLDLDGRLGTELLDHIRHEYGTAVFEGLDQKTGTKRRYKGTFAGPSDPLIDKIPSPEHGEEDSPERLRAVQREHLAELGWAGDDSRADGSGVGR